MEIITHSQIENTDAYKSLDAGKQAFAVRRSNRKLLSDAIVKFKNTSVIHGSITGHNLAIFKELTQPAV